MEVLKGELCAPLVGGACLNHRTVGIGGVTKLFSEVEFLIGVAAEVVMAGKLNGGGVWCVGLNDDFSFKLTTSCPTCDLGEQLEGALTGAEIGNVQAKVRVEHTNERDIGEVQAFGDHLGADDDVDFALAKFLQGFTQGVFTAHGVGVDACDSCLWEYFFDDALYLLGAVALAADGGVSTLGAFLGGQCLVATHVADEAVISAVIGERDSTVAALANMTTAGALHGAGESTAIEKQDDLLSLGKLNLHTAT